MTHDSFPKARVETTEPAPAGLGLIHEYDRSLRVSFEGAELLRYVYRPWDAPLESPRPYFHPIRTLGGDLVSLYRPHDHVWHKGIAWSLPNVGPANSRRDTTAANFWGGTTFTREAGYQQLDNNGSMRHEAFERIDVSPDRISVVHTLRWYTAQQQEWFTERRGFDIVVHPSVDAWSLTFTTEMTNITDEVIAIGSPTTNGRDNAGYGGLFWRGPRSFTGGAVHIPDITGGDELMGVRAPWMAFTGQHDEHSQYSTVVFVDAPDNPGSPPQWFVRSTPFAAVCPAPFFSEEVPVEPGQTLRLRYAVVIADGNRGRDGAAELAETGLSRLEAGDDTD